MTHAIRSPPPRDQTSDIGSKGLQHVNCFLNGAYWEADGGGENKRRHAKIHARPKEVIYPRLGV